MAAYKKHQAVTDDGYSEWVQPVMDGYKMSCCDCGLVHTMQFNALRVVEHQSGQAWVGEELDRDDYRVEFRVKRDNRATGQVRRHMKRNSGITLEFDPFRLVLDVVDDLYPDTRATVCWREGIQDDHGAWGCTEFGDGEPLISLDVGLPVHGAVEVLAHELAHVIAGPEADHGEAWQQAFAAIHNEYAKRVAA